MSIRHLCSLVALGVVGLLVVGCSGAPDSDVDSQSQEVVGIEDLSRLEQAMGFERDRHLAGSWQRPEANLTRGTCYKQTIGSANPERWTMRRYTTGAVFFEKASADTGGRAIACVDYDRKTDDYTQSLEGMGLDAILRYGLGEPDAPHKDYTDVDYQAFSRGDLVQASFDFNCLSLSYDYIGMSDAAAAAPLSPGNARHPGLVTLRDRYLTCRGNGNSKETCRKRGATACVEGLKRAATEHPIDYPAFGGYSFLSVGRYGQRRPATVLASLVYAFAWSKATNADIYNVANDPVGKFLAVDVDVNREDVRFERLDAHRVVSRDAATESGVEKITITPKSSDATLAESAIVSCSRPLTFASPYDDGLAVADFACTGL